MKKENFLSVYFKARQLNTKKGKAPNILFSLLILVCLQVAFSFSIKAEAVCEYLIWHGMVASDVGNAPGAGVTDDQKAKLTIETTEDAFGNYNGIRIAIEPYTFGATAKFRDNIQLINWNGTGALWNYGGGTLNSERILLFTETTNIGTPWFPNTDPGTPISFRASIFWTVDESNPNANSRNTFQVPFTINIGDVCTPDTDPPVFEFTPAFVSGGTQGVIVYTNITDNTQLHYCKLVAEDGSWSSEDVDLLTFKDEQNGSLMFLLPDGVALDETDVDVRVVAYDIKGNFSVSDVIAIKKTTDAPTIKSAGCFSSSDTHIKLNVAADPGTGGAVDKYKIEYDNPKKTIIEYVDSDENVTITGLESDTEYTFDVYAMDETGNVSSNSMQAVCSTTGLINPYCGYYLRGITYTNRDDMNASAFVWLTKTGTNEMTLLITHHPSTAPLSAYSFQIPGARLGDNGQINFALAPNANGNLAQATVQTNQFGTGTYYIYPPVDVSFDGGETTQKAGMIRFTGNFANMTNGISLTWYKYRPWSNNNNAYTLEIPNDAINFDELLNCPLVPNGDNVIMLDPVYWTEHDGNPFELDNPVPLKEKPVITDYIAGAPCANMRPPSVVFGTTFSPTTDNAGKEHLDIDEVSFYDMTTSYDFKVASAYKESYANGDFMDGSDGERKYAVVSNPKVLDKSLSRRTDNVNRLIFKLPVAIIEETVFTVELGGFTPRSNVTVKYDLEILNPVCYIASDAGVHVNLRTRVGATTQAHNDLSANTNQQMVVSGESDDYGKILISFVVQRSLACQALAISNFSVYGCIDKTIATKEGRCEGEEIEITAAGFAPGGEFVWEVSDTGSDPWVEFARTTENKTTIIPQLGLPKHYRVTSSIDPNPSVVEIAGEICCAPTESIVIWSEDFTFPEIANNYKHADWSDNGGLTKIVKNHGFVVGEGAGVVDGNYAVASNSSAVNAGTGILGGRYDHTTNNGSGGFLIINVGEIAVDELLIEKEIMGFCDEMPYSFSLWLLQVAGWGVNANLRFEIEAEYSPGNREVLTSHPTGEVIRETNMNNDQWKKYGVSFTVPKNTIRLFLRVYNYAASGDGNDICLDDFVLNACLPTVEIVGESEGKLLPGDARIECGKSLDMNIAFGGSESTYFDTRRGPYYLWQYRPSPDFPWVKIMAATPGTGSGLGEQYKTFSISSTDEELNGFFRVIVAQTEELANNVLTGGSIECTNIYGMSPEYEVACYPPTEYPVIALKGRIGGLLLEENEARVECGVGVMLSTSIVYGTESDFFDVVTGPYYLWQYATSSTGEWSAIPEGTAGNGSGAGLTYKNFNVSTAGEETDGFYRVIIAQTKQIAEDIAIGNLPANRNYVITNHFEISCWSDIPCDLPEVSLHPKGETDILLGEQVLLVGKIEKGENVTAYWKVGQDKQIKVQESSLEIGDEFRLPIQTYVDNMYYLSVENACGEGNEEEVFVKVTYPTAITPYSKDGKNDTFITGYGAHTQVFSRYGHRIYEGNDGWDGSYNGKVADPGVYYFIATFPNGEQKKGTVQVIKKTK